MPQQRWLHLPAPAKTRYRTNDPGSHAPPVVFSSLSFEDHFPSSNRSLTLSGYQAEGPDFLLLLRRISSDRESHWSLVLQLEKTRLRRSVFRFAEVAQTK